MTKWKVGATAAEQNACVVQVPGSAEPHLGCRPPKLPTNPTTRGFQNPS